MVLFRVGLKKGLWLRTQVDGFGASGASGVGVFSGCGFRGFGFMYMRNSSLKDAKGYLRNLLLASFSYLVDPSIVQGLYLG